jgi:hypothetical protein
VPYYTRVLSKHSEFPSLAELSAQLRANHPDFRLTVEEGEFEEGNLEESNEDQWDSLLLASSDGVEVALLERNPVSEGSLGQDEIAEFLEDLADAKPENNVAWLLDYLDEVKTIYAFQHLQGSETVDGSNALHALRTALWERGDAILQADGEGFTNEEGYHIVWQFSDTVSGPWNMAVLQDETWTHFTMDLGDPDHRAAFLSGEAPADVSAKPSAGRSD